MAWTQPSTTDWTTNLKVTASLMNTQLRANLVSIGDVHNHGSSTGSGAGSRSLGPLTRIDFSTQASPSTAGRLRRVGAHLQYYGTQLIRITQADAASTEPSPRTLGTAAAQAARGSHGHVSSNHSITARNTTGTANPLGSSYVTALTSFYATAGATKTCYNFTASKKISMFFYPISQLNAPTGGTLKVLLEADSVELDSITRSTGSPLCGSFALSGVKLKKTADINWKVKLQNNGTGSKRLQQHHFPATPLTATLYSVSTATIREAAADIGAA